MAQHSYPGEFRGKSAGNFIDQVGPAGGGVSAWTLGATIIDVPSFTPPSGRTWRILAIEFYVGFNLAIPGDLGKPAYGKLGKVIAALIPSDAHQTQGGNVNQAWINPMLPLPADLSLITTLFNGENDSAPAQFTLTNKVITPLTGGLNLSQPIDIYGGQQIGLGLWLTPSLAQMGLNNEQAGLLGSSSRYTIIYDDGL